MREEEKLAMDLYRELGAEWGIRTFTRIAESEQQHTGSLNCRHYQAAVYQREKRREVPSPELQKLLNCGTGKQIGDRHLKAGALVEELDIMDLRKAIEETKNEDLRMVFSNLERRVNESPWC